MFSLLPVSNKSNLLDVGCGVGTISLELQGRGFNVHGLDFSSIAVEKARERGVTADICDVDKDGLPFNDDSFDVVWAGDVVEHVFDPVFLLREMRRVIKPSGKILIKVPNDTHLLRRFYLFVTGESPQSGVYRRWGQCKHHTLFSLELLEYMLSEAGMVPNQISSIIDGRWHTKSRMLGLFVGGIFIVEYTGGMINL